jgi:peptidoglycan-associated lipoprotein
MHRSPTLRPIVFVTVCATSLFVLTGCRSAEKRPDDAVPAAVAKAPAQEKAAEDKPMAPGDVGLPQTGPLYFEFDSDQLSSESTETLARIAKYLQAEDAARIVIEGHADQRGSSEYNLALGDRRAAVARDYLKRLGVEEARVDVVSYGEEKPAADGSEEEALSKNRRDEFRFQIQQDKSSES